MTRYTYATFDPSKYSYFEFTRNYNEFGIAPQGYDLGFSQSPPIEDLKYMDSVERYAYDIDDDRTIEILVGLQESRLEAGKMQITRLCATEVTSDSQSPWLIFATVPDGLPGMIPSDHAVIRSKINSQIRGNGGELPSWATNCMRSAAGLVACFQRVTGEPIRTPRPRWLWSRLFSSHFWVEKRMKLIALLGVPGYNHEDFIHRHEVIGRVAIYDGTALCHLFGEENVSGVLDVPIEEPSWLKEGPEPIFLTKAISEVTDVGLDDARKMNLLPLNLHSLNEGLWVRMIRTYWLDVYVEGRHELYQASYLNFDWGELTDEQRTVAWDVFSHPAFADARRLSRDGDLVSIDLVRKLRGISSIPLWRSDIKRVRALVKLEGFSLRNVIVLSDESLAPATSVVGETNARA